jgi:hypothetical protein
LLLPRQMGWRRASCALFQGKPHATRPEALTR